MSNNSLLAGSCSSTAPNTAASAQVAVMGCPVNGVGEAVEADIGLGAGKGKGMLNRKGFQVKTVAEQDMVSEVLKLIEEEVRQREAGEVAPSPRRQALPLAVMPREANGVEQHGSPGRVS
jgi:hypothetical protein